MVTPQSCRSVELQEARRALQPIAEGFLSATRQCLFNFNPVTHLPLPGTTTGISAADRTATVRALADSNTKPSDFNRPGHIFPLVARNGGVLTRNGHTEATLGMAVISLGCLVMRGPSPFLSLCSPLMWLLAA